MQLSEVTGKFEQSKVELEDFSIQRNKLQMENNDQAGLIEDYENQLNQLTKVK